MSIASYGLVMASKVLGLHLHPYGIRILEGLAPVSGQTDQSGLGYMVCPCGDTHTNDAPEEGSYSVLDDLEYIVV